MSLPYIFTFLILSLKCFGEEYSNDVVQDMAKFDVVIEFY